MTPRNPRPNPYVGPRSFKIDEAEKFCGREMEIQRLTDLLIAERIVLLHAPCGAGKTSLVQAGVVPRFRDQRLKEKGFRVLPVARVNLEPPSNLREEPGFNRYVFSVLVSYEEGFNQDQPLSREQLSKLAGTSLPEYLADLSKQGQESEGSRDDRPTSQPAYSRQVLIFDQFEEILRIDPYDLKGKRDFFAQIGEVLDDRQIWALFVIREDYLAALTPYLRQVPTRLRNTFRLDFLNVDEARLAIREPLAKKAPEVTFDDNTARKLVDDLRGKMVQQPDGSFKEQLSPFVEPLQLQVVCYRLWESLTPTDDLVNEEDLAAMGDVDQALAGYYQDCVAAAAGEFRVSEKKIREWFEHRLISEEGIREQVRKGQDESAGLKNRIIERLIDSHLVRVERRGDRIWYELSHDRLIQPVRENNLMWFQKLSPLLKQADLWERQGRPPGMLLRESALEEAIKWAQRNEDQLEQTVIDFLRACLEARQLERREREREHRELQRTIELAEEERKRREAEEKRAEIEAESARGARRWAAVIAIAGLFAVFAAVVAFGLWTKVETESFLMKANESCLEDINKNKKECEQAAKLAGYQYKGLSQLVKFSWEVKKVTLQSNDISEVKKACQNGIDAKLAEEILQPACQRAIDLVRNTSDLSLVSGVCSAGRRAKLAEENVQPACQRAASLVEKSNDSSLVSDLCFSGREENLPYHIIQAACKRVPQLAEKSNDASLVKDLCFQGERAGLKDNDVQLACQRVVPLAVKSGSLYLVKDLCISGWEAGLAENDVQAACQRAIELVAKSDDPSLVKELCFSGWEVGLAENDVQAACQRAIDLSAQADDLDLLGMLCFSGREAGLVEDEIQSACERAIKMASQSEDPYLVKDLCFFGREEGLAEEGVKPACQRAIDLSAQADDPFLLSTLCSSGREAGLAEEDIQSVCQRAIGLSAQADDPFLLSTLCSSGRQAGLAQEDVQPVCQRAIDLAAQTDDPFLLSTLCSSGREAGLVEEDIQPVCQQAIDLAAQTDDPYLLSELCSYGPDAGLPDDIVQSACQQIGQPAP